MSKLVEMAKEPTVHKGSAKNTSIYKEPTPSSYGVGVMEFIDTISVFDYGPVTSFPGKGWATAQKSRHFFQLLEKAGIPTHFDGMVKYTTKIIKVAHSTKIRIKVAQRPKPYEKLPPESKNYILPIEIIFRPFTHPASSDLKKIKQGKRTYQELGYAEMPEPFKPIEPVKISFSTKFEDEDRVLSEEEAFEYAGLSREKGTELKEMARKVCDIITKDAAKKKLLHMDGKIEVVVSPEGEFVVVDACDTLDENRYIFLIDPESEKIIEDVLKATKDPDILKKLICVDWSKQMPRDYFEWVGWKNKVDEAKKKVEQLNRGIPRKEQEDWTNEKYCPKPPEIPSDTHKLFTEMYLADAFIRCDVPIPLEYAGEGGPGWFEFDGIVNDLLKLKKRGESGEFKPRVVA